MADGSQWQNQAGGAVAGRTRKDIEEKSAKRVSAKGNYLSDPQNKKKIAGKWECHAELRLVMLGRIASYLAMTRFIVRVCLPWACRTGREPLLHKVEKKLWTHTSRSKIYFGLMLTAANERVSLCTTWSLRKILRQIFLVWRSDCKIALTNQVDQ